MRNRAALITAASMLAPSAALAATLTVGPNGQHEKPCAAFAAAQDGDTVEIEASGNYDGDVCAITKNNLTIRGVGGRAKVDAAGNNAQGKAIWVVQGSDTTIENVQLSGCSVPDKNGAGIRQEGTNLTIRNCFFHDNENGILTGANEQSSIVIEHSEFARNGDGDGYAHNMYIGHIGSFTLKGSYTHHSRVGHLVKSRALKNYILYNRITGEDGSGSYEIDLPNGGLSLVIGNIIQQSASTQNGAIISYAKEGATNADSRLFVINNTFVNDRNSGTFINAQEGLGPIVLRNNIFAGGGTITSQANADLAGNFEGADPMFVAPATFDYHLANGSPCVNAGVDPGTTPEFPLTPDAQYVHPTSTQGRIAVGTIDIGAFELGGGAGSGGAGGDGGAGGAGGAATGGSAGAPGAGGSIADAGGSDANAGGSAGSDSSEAGVQPAAQPAADSADEGGCGCRIAGTTSNGWLLALAAIALALRTRGRRNA